MSMAHSREHSLAAGTEETIIENGSMERLQADTLTAESANRRQPVMSNGTTR